MFKTGVSFIRNSKKLFAGVDASPLCSRRCSQVEDTTIVHWVGVGSALTLVFV